MKILLTFAFLLSCAARLGAQQYSTPLKINNDVSGSSERSPMMRLDRNGNIFIAWVKADGDGNGPINMSVSTDGGMTFSPQVHVCADANCNSNFQRTAQFAIDTKGNIHLVWMGNRINSQPDIWYVRSTDMGKTWTKPVSVCDADDSSKYAQDFPSIACDSNDNLYVSFLDSRETQRKVSANVQLYFTRSTDGGMTWSVNKKANVLPGGIGGTCECCAEKIASSPDGHLYITFRSNINDVRDIWLARSYDKGMTFEPALKIQNGDWNIAGCPVSGPNITLDDSEGAHIVWRDARDDSNGVSHVYYAYVTSGSIAVPSNTAFDAKGASLANYPDVALFDHGKYKVLLYETANYGMRYILLNGSSPMVNNRPIPSGDMQEFGTILFASDGTRYISWQDGKNDAGDIYFCREQAPLSLENVKDRSNKTNFAIYPNPLTTNGRKLAIDYSAFSFTDFRITDVRGKEVFNTILDPGLTNKQIALPNLTAGNYYCIFNNGVEPEVRSLVITK
jgi:hypothetical protein